MMNTRLAFVVWLLAATVPAFGSITVPVLGWALSDVSAWLLVWSLFSGPLEQLVKSVISPTGDSVEFDTDSGVGRVGALLHACARRVKWWLDTSKPTAQGNSHATKKVTIQVAPLDTEKK